MSVLQIPSLNPARIGTRSVRSATRVVLSHPRTIGSAAVAAVALVIVAFGPAAASESVHLGIAAVLAVAALPVWAMMAILLGLFAVGTLIGGRERKARESAERFDVR